MSYKIEDITKMLDAGFTADEIKALDTDGLFTYASPAAPDPKEPEPKEPKPKEPKPKEPAPKEPKPKEPEPKEPEPKEPEPKEPEPKEPAPFDDFAKDVEETINKGFQSIINAFQVAAVGGSQQKIPEAKTSEDILAEIISPYSKEGGNK